MKLRLLLSLLILPMLCYGQDFLNNSDYIYGVGVAKTEAAADSLAMLSMARAIYTDVINETSMRVHSDGVKSKRSYDNNVSLKTRIRIVGSKKIVNRIKRKEYEVYRYFNKKEYVDQHIAVYEYKRTEADKLIFAEKHISNYRSDNPHTVNLILGSLYTAYDAVNDTLLNLLYPKSVVLRETLERDIKVLYDRAKSIRIWDGGQNGVMAYEMNHLPLPGFEYQNGNGEWVSPIVFKTADTQEITNDDTKKRWACIDGIVGKTYHILYEELVNGKYMKIPVPDFFYF